MKVSDLIQKYPKESPTTIGELRENHGFDFKDSHWNGKTTARPVSGGKEIAPFKSGVYLEYAFDNSTPVFFMHHEFDREVFVKMVVGSDYCVLNPEAEVYTKGKQDGKRNS